MSVLGDYLHDAGWYLGKARTRASNAVYRATRPWRSLTGEVRNRRNRRFIETGKGFAFERATRGLRSSLPVYRNRINRATGRPRRDDAEIYRRRDLRLARARQGGTFDPARAWEHSPDTYRSSPRQHAGDFPCRSTPWQHADAVLGRGTAARVQEAMRQANSNPWDVPDSRPGRYR